MSRTQTTSGGPKCPNHGVPLLDTGDRQKGIRKMQCPISTAIFEVQADDADKGVTVDKFGQAMTTYKINGAD